MKISFKAILALTALAVNTPASMSAQTQIEIRHYQAAAGNDAVWVATNAGLMRFDKQSGESKTFSTDKYNYLTAVALSPDGLVTVGGHGTQGVATFDGSEFSALKFDAHAPQNIAALVFADGLWVGATQMALHQNESGWKTYEGPNPVASHYDFHTLAYSEKESRMWVGVQSNTADNKFGYIDAAGLTFIQECTDNVNGLYVQDDGTVILATEKGMRKYADGKFSVLEHPISSIPADCKTVTGEGDVIWFAAGNTLVKGEGTTFKKYVCKKEDGTTDTITSIALDGETVWVTLYNGGLMKLVDGEFANPSAGVEESMAETETSKNDIYDLNGMRIEKPAKGQIYIQGGKKHIGK